MAKITPSSPTTASSNPYLNKARPVEATPQVRPEKENDITPDKPFVERRKAKDRRNQSASRGPYEIRSGRDRRKSSRKGRFIETDV